MVYLRASRWNVSQGPSGHDGNKLRLELAIRPVFGHGDREDAAVVGFVPRLVRGHAREEPPDELLDVSSALYVNLSADG